MKYISSTCTNPSRKYLKILENDPTKCHHKNVNTCRHKANLQTSCSISPFWMAKLIILKNFISPLIFDDNKRHMSHSSKSFHVNGICYHGKNFLCGVDEEDEEKGWCFLSFTISNGLLSCLLLKDVAKKSYLMESWSNLKNIMNQWREIIQ